MTEKYKKKIPFSEFFFVSHKKNLKPKIDCKKNKIILQVVDTDEYKF